LDTKLYCLTLKKFDIYSGCAKGDKNLESSPDNSLSFHFALESFFVKVSYVGNENASTG